MLIRETKCANFKWIDIENIQKGDLQSIVEKYNLNYYTLTDSLEPNHLPKFETEDNINFFIVRIIHTVINKKPTIEALSNKIAVFYNNKIIITIHRIPIPFLDDLEQVCNKNSKSLSSNDLIIKIIGHSLQTYNTSIVDVLKEIETYEDRLFSKESPSKTLHHRIYHLKRKINLCTKIILLTDEVINSIKPIKQERAAWQDVKDMHTKLVTLYEQVNEDLNNLLNLYISLSSQKTNDIMKTLTIFSIFFMPITFIAGIYGMNFKYMPELEREWGYPSIIFLMLIITIIIYYWLKRKKWL